ncbi:Site-specific DNA-methyltransferase (adenine-specific), Type III restriction system mod subunit [Methanocaldococcus bathoardescens]|uniref:site-specific DNA-methyltransferase (adenine-specific) n=1 Tax=Methanocaldococcus bathoardescens TaxID=1301915 RepID=A0A076LA45_9EURY|nr:DUF1156 domain-containing protein [Methanocaldococcus bathoardescens]AIJ05230.1 Site-specific DNA-methyltransferase (adenine-specific), Type III restriction system mod subunit [Methanocaldococcus bathoardescens]
MEEFPIKRAFIEEVFPVKEVSEESAKEKNIRHGHISTLHIWWARRPLASSRTTSYASLIEYSEEKEDDIKDFIKDLAKWENSTNSAIIKRAREDIKKSLGYVPRVLDPFSGGGAIPLECLRLGCEVYANDYNPVAVLILKAVLEYPQKYGRKKSIETMENKDSYEDTKKWKSILKYDTDDKNPLLEDVKKWGNYVLEEAKKEIGRFYPVDEDGSIPVGYIWARTVPCQNPSCNAEIPLMRQFWLAKKSNKKVALYPYVEDGEAKFKIVGDGYEKMPDDFDPSKGTVKRAIVTCPVCGSVIDAKTLRNLFKEGKSGERLVAVVLHNPKERGKKYRVATEMDVEIFKEAEIYLEKKREEFIDKWGFDPVPDEPLPPKGTLGFRVQGYGMDKWEDLFNARQKLALITFMDKIREAYYKILEELKDRENIEDKEDYAKAIVTYLAFGLDRLADYNSNLTVWAVAGEFIAHTFGRQALPMVWDYFELNPWSSATGDWNSAMDWIISVLEHLSQISPTENNSIPKVTHSSAISLPYPDNFFDAVFTDPPYYDNVPYSYLSDFFYVWLKRTIGDLYPDLFSTPLTPKSQEIVAYTHNKSWEDAKKFFEENLKKAFKEIYRVLKPNGIAVIVYAHKTTEGWETIINALLESGLVITASYPIHTEMKARLRAKESAALASSIYIVARKMQKEEIGWLNEVKEEIKKHLHKKLDKLWEEGIGGADFFISAIGSAIEIFGRYNKIMDYEGNEIKGDKLLEYVREIVTDYAVKQIIHNGFADELSPLSRFYLLYRWSYGTSKVIFDEARKLAQSVGLNLEKEWNKGFIKKDKEYIYLLGPHERKLEELKEPKDLVDVLHKVLKLWEKGDREGIIKTLQETNYLKDSFFKFAQAISETLPKDSKEKKLLDGFLVGRENIIKSAKDEKLDKWIK